MGAEVRERGSEGGWRCGEAASAPSAEGVCSAGVNLKGAGAALVEVEGSSAPAAARIEPLAKSGGLSLVV